MPLRFQLCNCDPRTAESRQCDLITGQCTCKADYTGDKCDQCSSGFYNHPNCQLCLCSADGTDPSSCNNSTGVCQCDNRGQCQCKVLDGCVCVCLCSCILVDLFSLNKRCNQRHLDWQIFSFILYSWIRNLISM